jgi:ABC-type transport system involved in multi-copper enzyme maturation permease subunit
MIRMLGVEIRRCCARRLVWVMVALAVLACLATMVLSYRAGVRDEHTNPFTLVDLHQSGDESIVGVAAFFLVIGGAVGGASMIGAEWRAGTFVTLLTWEPARRRVAAAKLLACGLVAGALALVLQALFVSAFLPVSLGPGTTEGADAAWLGSMSAAAFRVACMTGLVAVFMASVAMIGRSTAAALGFAFAYMLVFENLVRAWKPWSARYLLGENGAVFITGAQVEGLPFTPSTTAAALTLVGYAALMAAVAVVSFWRRDLATVS